MNKRIFIFVSLVSAVIFSLTLIPASRVYTVESRFSNAPDDDAQLDDWLRSQRGVVPHTVHVNRKGDMLVLTFIMSQNCWYHPPFPAVERAATRFGYSTDPGGFIDQPPD